MRSRARTSGYRLTSPGAFVVLVLIISFAGSGTGIDGHLINLATVGLATLLFLGVVAPIVAVRRLQVAASAPADLVVGNSAPVEISIEGRAERVSVRLLDPAGPWFATSTPANGPVEHLAEHRGVFPLLRVEVSSDWPLGLFTSARIHEVVLDGPVHVAPRPARALAVPKELPTEVSASTPSVTTPRNGESFRSVRPYQSGDLRKLVHWPTSARVGSLVVREFEPPIRTGLVVVLDLRIPSSEIGHSTPWSDLVSRRIDIDARSWLAGADGSAAEGGGDSPVEDQVSVGDRIEEAARNAAGLVVSALRQEAEVLLATFEIDGPCIERVVTVAAAGHRLARAIPGPPPAPPAGWPVEIVRP